MKETKNLERHDRMREKARGKIRLQFDFHPSVVEELDDLKDRLGCSSRGEVLRQALSHFRFLCDEVSQGGVLFVERQGERSRFQLAITPTAAK